MEENVLSSTEGIAMFPIISLIVFLIFFIVVIVWMVKSDKNLMKRMSGLPLADDAVHEESTIFNKSNPGQK